MSTEIVPSTNNSVAIGNTESGCFGSLTAFTEAQRIGKMFSESNIVPDTYKGKVADCVIALDMALRLRINPLAVMQNIYIVYGRPAWSSQFLISCINQSGLFKTPLRYRFEGKEGTPEWGCVAWAVDKSGETLESTKITLAMAQAEGWSSKSGSKWKTMPEQMLRYRAATFFARAYCPELTMGMQTREEIYDVESVPVVPSSAPTEQSAPKKSRAASVLEAALDVALNTEPSKPDNAKTSLLSDFETILGNIELATGSKGRLQLQEKRVVDALVAGRLSEAEAGNLNRVIKDKLEEL